MATLEVENLQAAVAEEDGEQILAGVDLEVKSNEIHALMGPNGSGKSTFAKVIAGHPAYEVNGGSIKLHLDDQDVADIDEELDEEDLHWELLELEPNERAALGIFLGFQYPKEIEGVTVTNFLRQALNAKADEREELFEDEEEDGEDADADEEEGYDSSPMEGPSDDGEIGVAEFQQRLQEQMQLLDIDGEYAQRYLNAGFSGGEKNRTKCCKQRYSNQPWRCLTRSTLVWTSTGCRMSPRGSTHSVTSKERECYRSLTTSGFSSTLNPITST